VAVKLRLTQKAKQNLQRQLNNGTNYRYISI